MGLKLGRMAGSRLFFSFSLHHGMFKGCRDTACAEAGVDQQQKAGGGCLTASRGEERHEGSNWLRVARHRE